MAECDCFYETFRFYKEKRSRSKELLELCHHSSSNKQEFNLCKPIRQFPGLKPFTEWKAQTYLHHNGLLEGLILMNNFMESCLVKYLAKKCLQDFTKKPHKTNLDSHVEYNSIENIWEDSIKTSKGKKLLKKLRWATLGYHHNWDTKEYSEESYSEFPEELANLSEVIAEACGYVNFKAEAAIINFYHENSSLSGHVDKSEYDTTLPIISISLGCSAVFLIGGTNKSVKPCPILLESGDAIVMSGQSRLCYHAVPCILPGIFKPLGHGTHSSGNDIGHAVLGTVPDEEWKHYEKFLRCSRININSRQVHPLKLLD